MKPNDKVYIKRNTGDYVLLSYSEINEPWRFRHVGELMGRKVYQLKPSRPNLKPVK